MKLNEIKKIVQVELKLIKDIAKYRGFYFKLEDAYVVANFCSNPAKSLNVKYSLGFECTKEESVVSHFFSKLKKGKKLTANEKIAFYEAVNLFDPSTQIGGKWYNFREVLHKVTGVQFYTLNKKISKKEVDIFYKYGNNHIDIKELGDL
jgi:hypothetical protein